MNPKFHCDMTCCVAINSKEGDCWIQLIKLCVVFDVTQISYQLSVSACQAHSGNEDCFPCLPSVPMQKTVSTEFTRVSKEFMQRKSVNRATQLMKESWMVSMVTEFTWLPKDFCKFAVLMELLLVNIGNHF